MLKLSTHGFEELWFAGKIDITPDWNFGKATYYSLTLNGTDIYAGMDSCRVAKSIDNGAHWDVVRLPAPSGTFVYSLLVKENSIYVATSNGMYVSDDNCKNWISIDSGMINSYIESLILRDNCLYASQFEKVALSKDNGTTWEIANAGQPDNPIRYVLECDSNLLGITPNGFYLSDKGGENWRKVNSGVPPFSCSKFTMNKTGLFAGNEDSIYHSIDSGAHWTPLNELPSYTKQLVGYNGKLYAGTTFDGLFIYDTTQSKWVNIYKGKESITEINSLYFHENDIYIEAEANLLCSYNGGSTWRPIFTQLGHPYITACAISGNNFLLGATNVYKVYFSSDAASNWSEINYEQDLNTRSLALNKNYAFAGTDGCGVWRWPLPNPPSIAK